MNKNLIALVVMFAGLSGVVAHADSILIERHSSVYDFDGTSFRFNDQQGTAWIDVKLSQNLGADLSGDMRHMGPVVRHTTVSATVPGLSYDSAAAQIVFTSNTSKIVCATITQKNGFFGRKSLINLTGACNTYIMHGRPTSSVYFEAK